MTKEYEAVKWRGREWGLFHKPTKNWVVFGTQKRICQRAAEMNEVLTALANSPPKPKFCPFCASADISELDRWEARTVDDQDNIAFLVEYQCRGKCEGQSFWV